MSSSQSKSIDVLCQEQLNLIRSGLQLTQRPLRPKKLQDACFGTLFDATDPKFQNVGWYLYSMLRHEQAYELIESCQLDYNSKFLVKTEYNVTTSSVGAKGVVTTEYLHLRGPPKFCRHYNNCKAYVLGQDFKPKTIADIRSGVGVELNKEWSEFFCGRLKGTMATLKIISNNPLMMLGIETALKIRDGLLIEEAETCGNSGGEMVEEMFKPYDNFTPVETPDVLLPEDFTGDEFRKNGISGAIAAKTALASVRPYLMCVGAWSDEFDWLECLVENINASRTACDIGILCPDSDTKQEVSDEFEHVEIRIFETTDSWDVSQSALLDYLVIYKAHSIGPAEAIKSLLRVKSDGCVVIVGDVKMPNLRVRNQLVRDTCGSILQWFLDKTRYPEYSTKKTAAFCMTTSPVCFGYNPKIFSLFNDMFYDNSLVNMTMGTAYDDSTLVFCPSRGVARMSGCSPYNLSEAGLCLELVKELVQDGWNGQSICVLTTYCAQKEKIANLMHDESSCSKVKVGILEDFENRTCDCLLISTVETSKRAGDGKRYPFDDLLYDRLCCNLALTRAKQKIVLIGDEDVLVKIDHWAKVIDRCKRISGERCN